MSYDTTSLDVVVMVGFLASIALYLAYKGELFKNW